MYGIYISSTKNIVDCGFHDVEHWHYILSYYEV